MSPSCALLSAIFLLAPGPFSTLDEALKALNAGESLRGRVTRKLGVAAAGEITVSTPGTRIDRLARVAWEGNAYLNVATRLLDHLEEDGPGTAVALAYLGQVRPRTMDIALEGRRDRWWLKLQALATFSDATIGNPAASLLARDAPPDQLGRSVRGHLEDHAEGQGKRRLLWIRRLLQAAPESGAPVAMLEVLGELEVPAVIRGDQDAALATLVRAHDEVCVRLLELNEAGSRETPLIRALGALRERHLDAGRALTYSLLEQDDPELLSAAVHAAGRLKLAELVPLLPSLVAADRPVGVRVAAIEAIPHVLEFGLDAQTLDLLLGLQEDISPEVREATYKALRGASGRNFPNRPELWQQWRTREPAYANDRLRVRRTGGGGGAPGSGAGIVPGQFRWGSPDPAPTPVVPAEVEPVATLGPMLALGGGFVALLLILVFAMVRDDTSPREVLRLRRLALGTGGGEEVAPAPARSATRSRPRPQRKRQGAQAWSQSFSRKQAVPPRALSGTERLERIVEVIEDHIPEPVAQAAPREGPSAWTMKLKRLVGGGGFKIYQEDEELEVPEFVAEARDEGAGDAAPSAFEDVGGRTAVASAEDFAARSGVAFVDELSSAVSGDTARVPGARVPTATRAMSRLLQDDDGGISSIIRAAKQVTNEEADEDRWEALERERAEEERRLSGAFRRLPSDEAQEIRAKAAALIPSDIDPSSRLFEDALRIRVHHLMREHEGASEPSPAELAEQSLAAQDGQAPKGKITAIIEEAARRGRASEDAEEEASAGFQALRQDRSAADLALWQSYEALPRKEIKRIRAQAAKLVPADIKRSSQAYVEAIRLRIVHLMRQRKEEAASAAALEAQFMAAQEEEAPRGKITSIIEAARQGRLSEAEDGDGDGNGDEVREGFAALRKDISAQNLELWSAYEQLDAGEAAELRERALKLVPADQGPGTPVHEDALRLRIVHLMRERQERGPYARPTQDEFAGRGVASRQQGQGEVEDSGAEEDGQ